MNRFQRKIRCVAAIWRVHTQVDTNRTKGEPSKQILNLNYSKHVCRKIIRSKIQSRWIHTKKTSDDYSWWSFQFKFLFNTNVEPLKLTFNITNFEFKTNIGLCSSCLKVVQSPYEPWIGKRIWLSMSSIGFDKMWDVIFLGKEIAIFKNASELFWLILFFLIRKKKENKRSTTTRRSDGGCRWRIKSKIFFLIICNFIRGTIHLFI